MKNETNPTTSSGRRPETSVAQEPQKTDRAVAASAGMEADFELEALSAEIEDERARAADDEFAEDLSTDLPDEEDGPARPHFEPGPTSRRL